MIESSYLNKYISLDPALFLLPPSETTDAIAWPHGLLLRCVAW